MATEKLDIMQTIREGILYGLKNFFPLLLMVILYAVTVWIPYLNIGTTIGLYKAVIGIGRGETIDPTAIFAKENFKNLSGFFLLLGLLYMGITVACFFILIPGLVMSIAWGFAVYFFLDKKVSPLKSLQLSYDSTFGNKWRIFLVGLLCGLLISVICGILTAIPKVGMVLCGVAAILSCAIMVAVEGVMYDFFSKKADEILSKKEKEEQKEEETDIVPTEA
ncbi:MAG: hypothetical protein IJQ69_01345 [Bacteroidales bacterium]|nr:hypothetical protein [Bacteroidales bacterium]